MAASSMGVLSVLEPRVSTSLWVVLTGAASSGGCAEFPVVNGEGSPVGVCLREVCSNRVCLREGCPNRVFLRLVRRGLRGSPRSLPALMVAGAEDGAGVGAEDSAAVAALARLSMAAAMWYSMVD